MRLIGWILGLVLLLGGAAEAAAKPAITDARLGVEPGLTRVVISLTQRSDFRSSPWPTPIASSST